VIRANLLQRLIGACQTAAVILIPVCAHGTTIVSVPKGIPGSPGIIADQFLEENWTSTVGFNDVTISAFVFTENAANTSATAYLTTQVGPGATSAELVAQANLTLPVGMSSPELLLFSGLDLAPGTYYLVLATTDTSDNEGWFNGDLSSSSAITAPGVTFNPPGFVANVVVDAAYPPGSTFSGTYPTGYAFDVATAAAAVPEPSSLALMGVGVLLLGGVILARLRFTPQNKTLVFWTMG
jgi:hypothetical protein